MAFQLKNQNDIKIFILYLLMNVPRPLSYNELNDIVVQDELVSSLDFAECIAQLEVTGNVAFPPGSQGEEGGGTFRITDQGKTVASTLESEFAGYIRTKSLKSALRYLSFKDQGVKVSVSTITQPDGRVKITFGLSEKENELLQISLQADNSYQARQMTLHFEEQPEIIYRSVLSLLSGDAGFLLDGR